MISQHDKELFENLFVLELAGDISDSRLPSNPETRYHSGSLGIRGILDKPDWEE